MNYESKVRQIFVEVDMIAKRSAQFELDHMEGLNVAPINNCLDILDNAKDLMKQSPELMQKLQSFMIEAQQLAEDLDGSGQFFMGVAYLEACTRWKRALREERESKELQEVQS